MTDKEFDRLIILACRARCSSAHDTGTSAGMLVRRAFIRRHIRPILYWTGAAAVIISTVLFYSRWQTGVSYDESINENYAGLIRNAESRIDRNKKTSGALREKIDHLIPIPTDYED